LDTLVAAEPTRQKEMRDNYKRSMAGTFKNSGGALAGEKERQCIKKNYTSNEDYCMVRGTRCTDRNRDKFEEC
jgi:hypothetical protein